MKIGITGLAFQSTNKGCEALTYSFLELLNSIAIKKNEIYDIMYIQKMPTKQFIKNKFSFKKTAEQLAPEKEYSNIRLNYILPWHTRKKIFYHYKISKCDLVVDFTEGDSFSDIYGIDRFWSDTNFKLTIIKHNVPLILGSQTIGPFIDEEIKKQAKKVLESCYEIFVRDKLSEQCVKEISHKKPILTTDIAFLLPYFSPKYKETGKIRIGINPSGLLWAGGITEKNQFGLTVDYKMYCREIIKYFLKENDCEVHLIPHATSLTSDGRAEIDSDCNACDELKNEFPTCILHDVFQSSIEAKSYISTMDFFVGARMHATIAALSSGVPVLPFSYSRKFEGLFNGLNYPYLIKGTKYTTETAIQATLDCYKSSDVMIKYVERSKNIAFKKLNSFENIILELLDSKTNNTGDYI